MSQPQPAPAVPTWLRAALVTLLALQVGLLWTHGSLLQRQHDDIQALRADVQDLADSLDQDDSDGNDTSDVDPNPRPVHLRIGHLAHRGRAGRVLRAAYLRAQDAPKQPDEQDEALKALKQDEATTRKSEQDAVVQGREVQEKLSWQENQRKAEEQAQREAQAGAWRWQPLAWGFAGLAVLGLLIRSVYRRRG